MKQWFLLRLLEIDFWVRVQYFSFGLILKNDCQIDFKSTFNRPSKDFEKWALSFKMIKKFLSSIHFLIPFIRFGIYILTFKSMRNRWLRFCHQILWRICQYPHLIAIVLVIEIFEKSISKSRGYSIIQKDSDKFSSLLQFPGVNCCQLGLSPQKVKASSTMKPEETFYRFHWHLKILFWKN